MRATLSLQGICLLVCMLLSNVTDAESGRDKRWKSAILNDDIKTLQQLLDTADDVAQQQAVNADNGKSALMIACKTGHLGLVRRLLNAGSDPHAVNVTGGTPFMFASLGGHTKIMQHLATLKVNINAKGANGWSATTIAAAKGYTPALILLMELGADINAPDVYNWTPLMRAVDNRHGKAVDVILADPRVELDHQDESGNTALHHAASNADADMIRKLLNAGIDAELKNLLGFRAFELLQDSRVADQLETLFVRD